MTESDLLGVLRDGGGLAIAAYLIWWLTRKLNGKFDRLATAVESLNHSIEELLKDVIGDD